MAGQADRDQSMERGNSIFISLSSLLLQCRNGGWVEAPGALLCMIKTGDRKIRRNDLIQVKGRLVNREDGSSLFIGEAELFYSKNLPLPFYDLLKQSHPLMETPEDSKDPRSEALHLLTARLDILNADTAGLLKALLLGLREDLNPEIYENFRKCGILHILALSGMHLGILTGLLMLVFMPLLGKKRSFVPVTLFLLGYLYLTGLKISLVRAAVMFFLLSLGPQFGRRADPLKILGITFLVSILAFPGQVKSAGFQLSFGAILGILILGRYLSRLLGSRLPTILGRRLGQLVGISLGAQLVTLPILLLHFGEVYPLGFMISIIITPLVTLFLMAGLVYLLMGGLFPQLNFLLKLALEEMYELICSITASMMVFPPWSPQGKMIQYFLVGGVFLTLLFFWRKRGGINSLRFSWSNKGLHGRTGTGHDQKIWSKFSHKSRGQE